MRFVNIVKYDERGVPPTQEQLNRLNKLIQEATKAGRILAVEGCMPSETGARVRFSNGKLIVTDGPFTESKELIGGVAILQADSKEEAVALVAQLLEVTGNAECELRQVFETNRHARGRECGLA